MAGLTNRIEQFLLEMLEEGHDGSVEIVRNELAQRFECAPSQINYVLTTRFTPYNGYHTESRRGGAGYIRIIRLKQSPQELVRDVIVDAVKESITLDKARHIVEALRQKELLSERDVRLMQLALDDHALSAVVPEERNTVRAAILRNMLIILLR